MKSLLFERKGKFVLYVVACMFPVFAQIMQIGVIALVFETVERQSMTFFRTAIFLAVGYFFLSAGLFILSRMMRISFMRDVLLTLRLRAFDKIMRMSYKRFNKKSRDVYVSNLINDINTFESAFFHSLINVIFRIGVYVLAITLLFVLNWMIALIVLFTSFMVLGLSKLFEKKTVAYQKAVSSENEAFTLDASNTFNGLEILKLNNMEEGFLDKSHKKLYRLEGKKKGFNLFTNLQIHTNETLGYILFTIILVILMYQTQVGLGLGEMVLVIQLATNSIFPLVNMTPLLNVIKSSKAIYEKITTPEDEEEFSETRTLPFSLQNAITLDEVRFAYEDGESDVLQKTSFTIEKGKKYLLRGPSGAGKSTLMKILNMTIDDYEGAIRVDDVDMKQVSLNSFNEKVAFIYQDVFLFEATLKENVTLFKDASDEEVLSVCEAAGLKEMIDALPDGLNTMIEENGKNLSGGERQRVSIARALFKKAELLFVDEATSALNDELGRKIEETILEMKATVIAISHKTFPGITERYDGVLELKNGYVTPFTSAEYFEEAFV